MRVLRILTGGVTVALFMKLTFRGLQCMRKRQFERSSDEPCRVATIPRGIKCVRLGEQQQLAAISWADGALERRSWSSVRLACLHPYLHP